jgi:hypothetical protein
MDANVNFEAREDAYTRPLDSIDVSVPELYQNDVYQPYFERLRREDPVHYCADSKFGPYWSVTRYKDIMTVAINHQVFSSKWELGGVRLEDQVQGYERPSFIQMDEPDHGQRRMAVSPAVAPPCASRGHFDQNGQIPPHPRGYRWFESISLQRRDTANHRFLSGGIAGMNPDLTDA